MMLEIGIIAGEILMLFDHTYESTDIENIKDSIDCHPDMILMALGSLIREGYVITNKRRNRIWVSMRDSEQDNATEVQERINTLYMNLTGT